MTDKPAESIRLTADDMYVLFDLLGRWVEDERLAPLRPLVRHEADLWVLNDLFCELERVIVPGGPGSLDAARAALMARHGHEPYPDR
jgi:hypothetical protein